MNKIKIYQVDAFADQIFTGNPAAVCMLDQWLSDEIMQSIAAENNLAETAFVVPQENSFEIRWFTPSVEVDLCGHATLASAYVLFHDFNFNGNVINFHSPHSGELKVSRKDDLLFLDFPTDLLEEASCYEQIEKGIGIKASKIYKGKTDYIAILDTEELVTDLSPNLEEISKLNGRGLIVTAQGKQVDFVSRFFAPQSGIDEDPVTGSAHTSLIPIWAKRLGKKDMVAKQLSDRGGTLYCEFNGARCSIGGNARLYMIGEINIEWDENISN